MDANRQTFDRLAPRLGLITSLGLGRLRPAPGTWGSLPPVAVAAVVTALVGLPGRADMSGGTGLLGEAVAPWAGFAWCMSMTVVFFVFAFACVRRGDEAMAVFNAKDPSSVTADETAGMALTLMMLPHFPMVNGPLTVLTIAFAFVAFRVMDIVKPWPCDRLQDWPAGWGILMDDLMAAVYAAAIVWIVTAWQFARLNLA